MRISQRNLPSILAKLIPYVSPLIVLLVFSLFAISVRFEAALTALLTIGAPIILASVIALWKVPLLKRSPTTILSGFRLRPQSFLYLVLLFILSYLVSLCFLVQGGPRLIAYFCLVAVMAGLLFFEILGTQPEHSNWPGIILAQMVLLSLNIIFGQTLRLPLYFGGTDLLGHMGYISTIINGGHVTSAMEGYIYFPLFHIFNTSGVLITGMQLQTSYFILNGLAFVISLPIIYLLAKQLTKDSRLSLLATLLYCLNREVIFNGMYMNTREMAYLFCLLILYLLIQENRWLKIIAICLILPLVLLHQTTLLHFSVILVVIMIIEFILRRRFQYISLNYIILFIVAYVGYWFWICHPFLQGWIITASGSETVSIPMTTPAVRDTLINTLAKNGDYFILLFFIPIGIVSQLYQDARDVTMGHVIALFTFITFPFFIPDIATILSPLFLTYRLALLLSPFIALAMAAGVLALITQLDINRHRLKAVMLLMPILLIILLYSFSTVFLQGSTTDLNLRQLGVMDVRQYFTRAELKSFSFIVEYKGDVPISTDYHSARYLKGYLRIPWKQTVDTLETEEIGEGYMLFRKEEFELRGVLLFEPKEGTTSIYSESYQYRTGMTPDLETMWQKENKIFNNGSVQIYLK